VRLSSAAKASIPARGVNAEIWALVVIVAFFCFVQLCRVKGLGCHLLCPYCVCRFSSRCCVWEGEVGVVDVSLAGVEDFAALFGG
jgi:hypothetical protein